MSPSNQTPSPDPEAAASRPVLLVGQGAELDALAASLEQLGLTVHLATDGPHAFDSFGSSHPGVAVIDLSGVQLDGPEVCEGLARMDETGIPKLVVVDRQDGEGMARAFEAGASDVVARPYFPGFLARRLGHLMRRSGASHVGRSCSLDRTTGLADKDELTGSVTRAIEQARLDGTTVALLHLELERFRELVHGLPTGSATQLLTAVARRLRTGIRASDVLGEEAGRLDRAMIARTGGGEFSILLQGLKRVEDAAKAGRRLLDALAEPFETEGRSVELGATLGIASFPQEDLGALELLECAATAAHNGLEEGSGTIRFYAPSMNVKAFERMSLETSMREGLERDEFCVYYQPRIDIPSGKIVGFEALVRWQHPQLGLVSPSQFIPLAEETGLIVPIGDHVLRTACLQNREWQRQGLDPVSVSVNLSSVQFQDPELYESVVRTLGETGLDPIWLELELTESLLMQNAEAVVGTLKRFRDTGIKLSIDDFGTGYSSLSYLTRFPIDALKIDRSFIREVTSNADDAALATSIILMGRSLKLKVVAEGVETSSQLSFLRIMQCDEAQGFLYSPPVAAKEAERMLREGPSVAAA